MSRLKVMLIAAVATCAFATAATAASAHEYRVNGKGITKAFDTHSVTLTRTAVFLATPFGVAVHIECTHQVTLTILLPSGASLTTIVFSTCTVVKPANCTLAQTTAKTKGTLLSASETEFAPESGTDFDTITLEGSSCSLKEKPFEVTGTQKCTTPEAESEKSEHSVECATSGSALKAGGKAATFEDTIPGLAIVNEKGEPTGELYSSV